MIGEDKDDVMKEDEILSDNEDSGNTVYTDAQTIKSGSDSDYSIFSDDGYEENKNVANGVNLVSCKDVKKCEVLKNLVGVLKFYGNKHTESELLQMMEENENVLNDFHHILYEHLNEDTMDKYSVNENFAFIYKYLVEENGLFCDVNKCGIYARYRREREREEICTENNGYYPKIYQDILDMIYCYFIHSINTGHRIINKLNVNDDQNDDQKQQNDDDRDLEIIGMKSYLETKKKHLEEIMGKNRFSNNKFNTQIMFS